MVVMVVRMTEMVMVRKKDNGGDGDNIFTSDIINKQPAVKGGCCEKQACESSSQ